jgi:DNA (cytosine-5)-methyltransferase 1
MNMANKNKMYRLIDLFAGAGGMSLGFTSPEFCGSFKCVLALDNDKSSGITHKANIGGPTVTENIETWLSAYPQIPEADIVIGGPPCQGFSLLNKNRIGDARRELWEPYMDVVEASKASVFIMENVPGLLKSEEFLRIQKRAEELGFSLKNEVLNSADYGAPQIRKRAVIIGWRSNLSEPAFPPLPTHASSNSNNKLPPWRTVRDAIGDLPEPVGTEIRKEKAPLDLHFTRNPTAVSLKRYKAVPPGGNRFDLQRNAPDITPACWIRKTSGGTDLFGRLWWDKPSVTIRTEFFKPEKGRYLHPVQHRPITHREAARLMGFPDTFKFFGSKTEIARQIGNAVCPPLAGVLAQLAVDLLDSAKKKNNYEILYSEAA